MRHGEKTIFMLIASVGLGWSSWGHPAGYGAAELLDAVADTPTGSELKIPVGVLSSQVEAAFLVLDRSLTLIPVGGHSRTATLSGTDSFRINLTKKQMEGLRSLADGFDQKIKSGEIKIDPTGGLGLKPRFPGAAAANEETPCIDRGMPWHHRGGMSGDHMGWGLWHMNDDYHRDRMGHDWWTWSASLSKWGASVYMSRSYFQLRCLNDDGMTETMSMPGWFTAVAAKLPCPEEPVARNCPQQGVRILWNDQYWIQK